MSGLILPPQETTIIRGVAKSAALLFTLMFIERTYPGRPASDAELALLMQVDERTVRKQATALSALGLVTAQGTKWLLTPEGRRTLFGNFQPSLLSIENSEPPYLEGEISAQNVPHDMNDDDAKNVDSDSSSSSESAKCARTLQILRATAMLFEDAVFVAPGMSNLEPDFVLGWVAKAYADRARLHNPLGLLYRRLNEMASLPVIYRKDPTRGLPAEFLREIGMEEKAVSVEEEQRPISLEDWLPKPVEPERYPGESDHDAYGRNLRWLEVLRDERSYIDKVKKGILEKVHGPFSSKEPISIAGNVMKVFLNEKIYTNALEYTDILSSIYAEQCGDPSARVEFEMEA